MTSPLPPASLRDADAMIIFMRTSLGITIKGDNVLACWGEHPPPQPASIATVTTQANSVLSGADATTFVAAVTKKKAGK